MILRIQRERQDAAYFPHSENIDPLRTDKRPANLAKEDAIVLHPGPMNRGIEIASEVADSSRSLILDQVKYGVSVRMAVLYLATGGYANGSTNDAAATFCLHGCFILANHELRASSNCSMNLYRTATSSTPCA